jgi:hypothetical protein
VTGATVYRFRGRYFITRTVGTGGVAIGPWLSLQTDVDDMTLGQAIGLALVESALPYERPSDFLHLLDPAAKLAGVKSSRTFDRQSSQVSIREQEGSLALTEYQRDKRGSLYANAEHVRSIGAPDDEALGMQVRLAVERGTE